MTAAEILRLVATSTFRSFNQNDWDAYSGCESADPLIAEVDGKTIIIDDGRVEVNYEKPNGQQVALMIEVPAEVLSLF